MFVHLTHRVPDVDPQAALAWWSDFREGHSDHPFVPGSRRRILGRGAQHVTMLEESQIPGFRAFRETATAWREGNAVRFVGVNNFAAFDGSYSFEPDGVGTSIRLDAHVRLVPGLRWGAVAARPLVEAILRVDLALHAKEMRRDVVPDRKNGQSRRA